MFVFPGGLVVENPPANAGDTGSIPRSERLPGEGDGNLLQYFCLEKSHGQRSLTGYSLWGCKRAGHDLAAEDTGTAIFNRNSYIRVCVPGVGMIGNYV